MIEGFLAGLDLPQVVEMAMERSNAWDLLSGHGGDHREAESQGGDEPLALAECKLSTAVIEHVGIKDRLELVGHDDKLLLIHPKLLRWIPLC